MMYDMYVHTYIQYVYQYLDNVNQAASMVQWLGFYPSKVEVGVRFTVVASNLFSYFCSLFSLYHTNTVHMIYFYILIIKIYIILYLNKKIIKYLITNV